MALHIEPAIDIDVETATPEPIAEDLPALSEELEEDPRLDSADLIVDAELPVDEIADLEQEAAEAQNALDAEFLDQGTLELLGIYLHEVRRFPLLTADEEISLARAHRRGRDAQEALDGGLESREERLRCDALAKTGERARRRLVESNLRLVISVARKHLNRGLPLPDLIQEGNIGLSRAVEKYDWRRGFRFSTYAYWWIRQAITRAIADQSRVVRIPVHMTGQISRFARASGRLAQELGREPTVEEIARSLDVPAARIEEIHLAAQVPISLDAPAGEDFDGQIGDFIEDERQPTLLDSVARSLLKDSLREAMSGLNPREQKVVALRFGLGDGTMRTLAEVGDELQISRERVRQIESDALRKLRRPTIRRRLAEYLG